MLYCRQKMIHRIHYTNKFQHLRFVQLSPNSMTEVLLLFQADLYCNLSSTDRTPRLVRDMLQCVFFVTNYQYSFDCALCFTLYFQKMESNIATLKQKKQKQNRGYSKTFSSICISCQTTLKWVGIVLPHPCNLLVFTFSAAGVLVHRPRRKEPLKKLQSIPSIQGQRFTFF